MLKYLDISQTMYGPLYSSIEHLVRNFDSTKINVDTLIRIDIIILCSVLYLCYICYPYILQKIKKCRKVPDNNITLFIYNDSDIKTFCEYINFFPEFYSIPTHVVYGDPSLLITSREYIRNSDIEDMSYYKKAGDGIIINFHDTNFNVKGYYMWEKTEVHIEKDKDNGRKSLELPYIILSVENVNNININTYFDNIIKKCDEMNDNIQRIYHIKILKNNNEIIDNDFMIYSGEKRSADLLSKLYIDSFFHKEKTRLWRLIKEIHFSPETFYKFGQTPHIGLLLYGPPGTGKSTFAFRVAMALNRHIISIDLRSIKNKHEIYQIMRRPLIKGIRYQPKDVVFMFDEFDLTVIELHAKKKKMATAYNNWMSFISNIDNLEKDKNGDKKELKLDDKKIEKKLINKIADNDDIVSDIDSDEDDDGKIDGDDAIAVKKDYTMEHYGYDTQDLSLEDLLEIFQGPVPLEGSIIFATTNKYEEIKQLCPALFRTGRLTPISFNNADNILINDLCKYFYGREFDKTINITPEDNIMPAHLIEIASESKLMNIDEPYEYFLACVKKILHLS
jgi:hypothetical protein